MVVPSRHTGGNRKCGRAGTAFCCLCRRCAAAAIGVIGKSVGHLCRGGPLRHKVNGIGCLRGSCAGVSGKDRRTRFCFLGPSNDFPARIHLCFCGLYLFSDFRTGYGMVIAAVAFTILAGIWFVPTNAIAVSSAKGRIHIQNLKFAGLLFVGLQCRQRGHRQQRAYHHRCQEKGQEFCHPFSHKTLTSFNFRAFPAGLCTCPASHREYNLPCLSNAGKTCHRAFAFL